MPDKPTLTQEERCAKRAERREKQRRENIGRAKKMQQARLEFDKQPIGHITIKGQPQRNTTSVVQVGSIGIGVISSIRKI